MDKQKNYTILTKVIDISLSIFTRFITGIKPQPLSAFSRNKPKVYYANHNSHGDFILVWTSLPRKLRLRTRPVAGKDYWSGNALKRFIINQVFRALLIERSSHDPQSAIQQMSAELKQYHSLIFFPEGTRNLDDDVLLQNFKSGLYHLAKENPKTEFVPVWIENIEHVLPKGKILPVPILCHVHFGEGLFLQENEDKEHFLVRAREAMLDLSTQGNQSI